MRFNKNDRTLLAAIAEHRILTVKQLSTLSQRSCQVIRRRVRDWAREGLIITKTHVYGRGRGRPEDIILLGEKSLALFAEERIPSVNRAGERPEDTSCLDHRLLTNWFRIYLLQIERCIPQISVKYLNQNLPPLFENGNESTLQLERISTDKKSRKFIEFIPDGVFSITYRGAEKKTLLFFLEVDMGTETIASMDRGQKDIRQKILNYQALFRSGGYKGYERVLDAQLNGFRLLFLVSSAARLVSLCRLVREMPPSDFVWLAAQENMFSHGLSAKIWARGGRDADPLQSILETGSPVTSLSLTLRIRGKGLSRSSIEPILLISCPS